MSAALGYDTTRFQALRRDLQRLNGAALRTGLIAPRDVSARVPTLGEKGEPAEAGSAEPGTTPAPGGNPQPMAAGSADKGKASATQLLALLGRIEGDDSPAIRGTTFTESGVLRLLTHLRRPRSQHNRFFQRLYRFLIRPVALGVHTSAGISIERLQLVSRQLLEIEADGWHHFQTRRVLRRGARANPSRLDPAAPSQPAASTAVPPAAHPAESKAS